ncbi:MAG: hypothetical protein LPK47_03290 [Bacteroidota bacterium]|nr:hypothetical protein [Bacteroidota bacterium]
MKCKLSIFLVLGLFLCIISISWIPLTSPLKGHFEKKDLPKWSISNWMNLKYQDSFEDWFRDELPGRQNLIRIRNQWDYSIWRIPHAKIVVGKNGNFFEESYLNYFSGTDLISDSILNYRFTNIERLEKICFEHGKKLIIAIAPSKTSFFVKDIPDIYPQSKTTNLTRWKRKFDKSGIPVIDLSEYLKNVADTSNYPIFPKEGIHWTEYANILALEKIVNYLSEIDPDFNNTIKLKNIKKRYLPLDYEKDLGEALNLFITPKSDPFFGTFDLSIESKPEKKHGLLCISDSFFWQWYGSGIISKIFDPCWFFYYNNQPYLFGSGLQTEPIDTLFQKAFIESDFILLMATEANFKDFPWNIQFN